MNKIFDELVTLFNNSKGEIVKKYWGFEYIPTNNNNYCLKGLVFYKGQEIPNHYHKVKTESWYCVSGKLKCLLADKEFFILPGDVIDILDVEVPHKLWAIEDSIIFEVSTHHSDSDTIRLDNPGEKYESKRT
jgi:quercetin dioxygenase-like cupin family protein